MSLEPTVNRELEIRAAGGAPRRRRLADTGTVHRVPDASEKVTVPVGVSWLPRPDAAGGHRGREVDGLAGPVGARAGAGHGGGRGVLDDLLVERVRRCCPR